MQKLIRASTALALVCLVVTAMGYFRFSTSEATIMNDAPKTSLQLAQLFQNDSVEALPVQLSMADRFLYRRLFAMQEAGKWQEANALMRSLSNPILVAKLQAQRYLHPNYLTKPQELAFWLSQHDHLAEAPRLTQLAQRKGLRVATSSIVRIKPAAPRRAVDTKTEIRFGRALLNKYLPESPLRTDVALRLKSGNRLQALNQIARTRGLTFRHTDLLRWMVAGSSYNHGDYAQAANLAGASAERSGDEIPALHWLAGMAEWHLGKTTKAYHHFAAMAAAPSQLPLADVAAAAFWAHRAAAKLGKTEAAKRYLQQAANTADSFYGIQATLALAEIQAEKAEDYALKQEDLSALQQHHAADTILALAEIGAKDKAATELQFQLAGISENSASHAALLAVAHRLEIPTHTNLPTAMFNRAQYPVPYAVSRSDTVDPALVLAIMKQESGFNPHAQSHRGASGLMQITPETAESLMQHASAQVRQAIRQNGMSHASANMALGQQYLAQLQRNPMIGDNLIYMLAAYNAGPGVLAKWRRERGDQADPLLFVESIPYTETRSYVLQVLKNYWAYSTLAGNRNTAITALLAGQWPLSQGSKQVAAADTHSPKL